MSDSSSLSDLRSLVTESVNPGTTHIDAVSILEALRLMHAEDRKAVAAVELVLQSVAEAVERIVRSLESGGRLFYVGAGTSGRLGALDAVECPPTFSTPSELVQAVVAGAPDSLWRAVESNEDDPEAGAHDLLARSPRAGDVVIGIAASGRTPYTIGALKAARDQGCLTIALTANPASPLAAVADIEIAPVTGPEAIAGSTRLKAGTAHKLILNMISTVTMVRLGKVYRNLMVDLRPTNAKLVQRSRRIVELATGVSPEEAGTALAAAGGRPKVAIVVILAKVPVERAEALLREAEGHVREAVRRVGRAEPE